MDPIKFLACDWDEFVEIWEMYKKEELRKIQVYDELQKPFLLKTLPEKIDQLLQELNYLQNPMWERASFEKVVTALSEIECDYQKLHKIGLKSFFKREFYFRIGKFTDSLFEKIHGADYLTLPLSSNHKNNEDRSLDQIFIQHREATSQNPIKWDETKRRILIFLKWIREETLSQVLFPKLPLVDIPFDEIDTAIMEKSDSLIEM